MMEKSERTAVTWELNPAFEDWIVEELKRAELWPLLRLNQVGDAELAMLSL